MPASDPGRYPPEVLELLRQLQPLAREAQGILRAGLLPRLTRAPSGELAASQAVRLTADQEDRLGQLNLQMEPLRQQLRRLGVRLSDAEVSQTDL